MGDFMVVEWWSNGIYPLVIKFFPHIQGFKSNQGSHVILVALICSINIEPFRKNRESKKLNLALGLRVTSNSATLKFTREEPPSGLLTLRMPEPTVDPTNYWNQSRPMILRQNIPEFYQVGFAMDPTLFAMDPTLSKHFLRWILLCPNTFCDGSYFVQTLFAMDPTLSKHFLRWILLCPNTFCDGSYFVQTLFAMDPTLSKHFLRWILLCPNTFCDGSYFVQH